MVRENTVKTDNFELKPAEHTDAADRIPAAAMPPHMRVVRPTRSVCPVCRKTLPAVLARFEERAGVYLQRECPDHGLFRTMVWQDHMSFENWIRRETLLSDAEKHCSGDCRACASHPQDTCCVILEVSRRCNLHCTYCFANGGAPGNYRGEAPAQPSFEELCASVDRIIQLAGSPLLQLSGGEPTLRDDLPELVQYARKAGCSYVQINTNGIRLAADEAYVGKLAEAGLDIAFLQFDGTDDGIYRALRGQALLETKLAAIANCGKHGIGVTLVPTIVPGINDHEIGNIVRKAVELFPAVRSVHFQPVTYMDRFPAPGTASSGSGQLIADAPDPASSGSGQLTADAPGAPPEKRYTLDALMHDLCIQTGIPETSLLPSRCDHAVCEFHAKFIFNARRELVPVTDQAFDARQERTTAARNRRYVAEHWRGRPEPADLPLLPPPGERLAAEEREPLEFDDFVRQLRFRSMTVSAMAFQDRFNMDLERLCRCSLHIYENGKLLPFCGKYM